MAHRVPITIRLESFEGPLDLLLYLIQSHEMDISRVSLSRITDQYLAYVRLMQELNFDTASEFLVMAATLLHWKSKSLLPDENKAAADAEAFADLGLSQEELLRQLMEHKRFLKAGEILSQLSLLGEDVFTRANRKPPVERIWKEMDMTGIATTYQDILLRARKRTQVLKKETVSLTGKIQEFSEGLSIGKLKALRTFIHQTPEISGERAETVVTFLASLELSRLKKMRLHQEGTYEEIYLELLETLTHFDLSLASGFDAEDSQALGAVAQVEHDIQAQVELDATEERTQI